MNDQYANDLLTPISSLTTIRPNIKKALIKISGNRIIDLLFLLPLSINCRKLINNLENIKNGEIVTCKVEIIEHKLVKRFRKARVPYKVICDLNGNDISLVFFNINKPYIKKLLITGNSYIISGKLEYYNGTWQITHPDHIGDLTTLSNWIGIQANYPLTSGLNQKNVRNSINQITQKIPEIPEWLSPQTMKLHPNWNSWGKSIIAVHTPQNSADLLPENPVKERLAYDELLANQVALQLVRHHHRKTKGTKYNNTESLLKKGMEIIPFSLTADQLNALNEIKSDMYSNNRMQRLLQGDVGSGKTIVAFLTALIAIENNMQVAIMVPTEIIARQHYQSISTLANKINVSVALLLGKDKESQKKFTYEACATNNINIVIGTHALIQEKLSFAKLGLVVIDEQHRFGVDQRLSLINKGKNVDCLSMTATPIPRTLMLTTYGDLDCTQLREKPKERKEIVTKTVSLNRLLEVIEGIKRAIKNDGKIFWVCPLIEESDVLNLTAAEDRFQLLKQHIPEKAGIIHGKMKSIEKNTMMENFISGKIKVLIATTVIEVGIDVPDATIMVIEHAESFGLAQLHQLRGRVGRGTKEGTCILLYDPNINEISQRRLNIIKNTNDGFILAEEDWKIRGGGEFLGSKQSGVPNFKFVDWQAHKPLFREACIEARVIIQDDPLLNNTDKGVAIKNLLLLFNKEDSLKYLNA